MQRFSTWGKHTPGGTPETQGGTQNVNFTDVFRFGGFANTKRFRTADLEVIGSNPGTVYWMDASDNESKLLH